MALWLSLDDPYAVDPEIEMSQHEIAMLANRIKVETTQKALRALERVGALTRLKKGPRGRARRYQLHQHSKATPVTRPRLRQAPARETSKPGGRRDSPPLQPPPGVSRDEIGTVLATMPGVRANLRYSGPGAWQVNDAIAVMHEAGWGLTELDAACRAYSDDTREDKPPADKLFSGVKRRSDAIERYGLTSPAKDLEPAPKSATPVLSPAQWVDYFAGLVPRDEAEQLVTTHGEVITAMGSSGIKTAVMVWKTKRDGSDLASIFAEHES